MIRSASSIPSILVVDDDDSVRGLLSHHLGVAYDCQTAAGGVEAIELLNRLHFNLVLTDITMPGIPGLELCRYITEKFTETVVVVVSALANIDHVISALRGGAFDYLTKPFELPDLNIAVERALKHQAAISAERLYEAALEEQVRRRTAELSAVNDKLGSLASALYDTYRATLQGLANTLEARDLETRGHSERVVAYSLRLGQELALQKSELIGLEQGALLHDIGKVGVRDSILRKPGSLTPTEWTQMREHVAHGVRIVEGIDFLHRAKCVVAQHHEKYNGSGYPNRLAGDHIHINARIFAVADAYDAITSNRPYRNGRQYGQAAEEIQAHSGTHFDPRVVDAFLSVKEDEWVEIRRSVRERRDSIPGASKEDVQSFVMSLNCPPDIGGKLTALFA
ncbi:MAG TPA: HD domain-containing phosphohydrolase [Blastocatellia bacterium]|nr:HD domain-containing phosphohydrolase [Blastocatellia bacterium]